MLVSPGDLPKGTVEGGNHRLGHLSCCTRACSSMEEFVQCRLKTTVRGHVLFWAVLPSVLKSVDDGKPCCPSWVSLGDVGSCSHCSCIPRAHRFVHSGEACVGCWVFPCVTYAWCWKVLWTMCYPWAMSQDSQSGQRHRENLYLRPVEIKGQPRPHRRQFPTLIPNFSLPLICCPCPIPRLGQGAVHRKSHPLRDAPNSNLWVPTEEPAGTTVLVHVEVALPPLRTVAPVKSAVFGHYRCGLYWRGGSAIHQGAPVSTRYVPATVKQR